MAFPMTIDSLGNDIRVEFTNFLATFSTEPDVFPYVLQCQLAHSADKSTLIVDFNHLMQHETRLAELIRVEYYRFRS